MFEFFIALFGGIYYLNKFLGDKAKSDRYKRNREAVRNYHLKRLFCWIDQVCDRSLEEELMRSIEEAQDHHWAKGVGEEIWTEVRDAYLHMPTRKEFAEKTLHLSAINSTFFIPKTKKQWEDRIKAQKAERERYLNILLARRGKVRSVSLHSGDILDTLYPGSDKYLKGAWDKTFEYWVYIRDELLRNGIGARLIFIPVQTADVGRYPMAYDVDDVDKFHYHWGKLTWLPLTNYDDNLQYMM